MNNALFENATTSYANRDYAAALKGFTDCLEDAGNPLQAGETGLLYHHIGNCLVRLGDYNEAIRSFAQATGDEAYDDLGAVNCNLGMCYAKLRDYEDAVRYFEAAVSDSRYSTPYKAYLGMGNALLRLGKSAEAGAAYRSAALDSANPDPTKALLNLGVCFMALNRPADAVTSYESALQFDMSSATRNKLYANLGQAYVANNQFQKAISAFENALSDKTYFLNDAASVDYQRAIAMVSTGTAVIDLKQGQNGTGGTGSTSGSDTSGIDVMAPDAAEYEGLYEDQPAVDEQATQATQVIPPVAEEGTPAAQADERFFTATDEEIEQYSRNKAKEGRKSRHVGRKILIVIIILVVLVVGAGAFAYTQGYGYPTQEQMTQQLFSNPSDSSSLFASSVDQDSVDNMVSPIIQTDNVQIDGVDRSMNNSTVYASATTSQGGTVQYAISFTRDMIGWKIDNVELNFTSQNGSGANSSSSSK